MATNYGLNASSATVTEGNQLVFTITRSGDLPAETVWFSTLSDGTATFGEGDYTTTSGGAPANIPVTFGVGVTSLTVTLNIINDGMADSGEQFRAIVQRNSSDPVATFLVRSNFVTIDDAVQPTTYSLTPVSTTVTESNTDITFTITRSGGLPAETLFASTLFDTASSASGDYNPLVNQQVSFGAGQTTASFTVHVNDDAGVEGNEHFRVMIARNPGDQSAQALDISDINIQDNDTVAVSYSLTPVSTSVTEGNTDITFTVTRSGSFPAETLFASTLFDTATSASGDYNPLVNQQISFGSGQSTATFTVHINDDASVEATEHFRVMIARNPGDQSAQALDISDINIQDNDSAQGTTYSLTPASTTLTEGSADITFTITRSGSFPAETLFASTLVDTASSASGDYNPIVNQQISFSAGQSTATFTVHINDDASTESTEHFRVMIARNPGDQSAQALDISDINIQDDDAAQNTAYSLTPSSEFATEGGQVTFTITRSGSLPSETVWFSTLAGTATYDEGDYATTSGARPENISVTFGAGVVSQTITLNILNDGESDGGEQFRAIVQRDSTDPTTTFLARSNFVAIGDTVQTTGYSLTPAATTVTENETDITFTITRTGNLSGETLFASTLFDTASSAGGDYDQLVNHQVSFVNGQTSATFTVHVNEDVDPESTEHFRVMIARNPSDQSAQALDISDVNIQDDDGISTGYSLTPGSTTVTEGDTNVTFTVTRTGNFVSETIYASTLFDTASAANGDYVQMVNVPVTFAVGAATATFAVTIRGDQLIEGDEHFRVMIARNPNDQSAQALDISDVNIADDEAGSTGYAIAPGTPSITEADGAAITFAITRTGSLVAETIYASTVQDRGWHNEGDYETDVNNLPVSFAAGQATAFVTVGILDDTTPEANERFGFIVQRNPGDALTQTLANATFTIANDDGANWSISTTNPNPNETQDTLTFTITRPEGLSAQTVYVTTTADQGSPNQSDFHWLADKPVTFAAGATTRTVTVDLNDDLSEEQTETFAVVVRDAADASAGQRLAATTFSIEDDDEGVASPVLPSSASLFEQHGANGEVAFLARLALAAYDLHGFERQQSEDGSTTYNTVTPGAEAAYYELLSDGLVTLTVADLGGQLAPLSTVDVFGTRGLVDGIYTNKNAAALVLRSGDSLFVAFRGTNDDPDPWRILRQEDPTFDQEHWADAWFVNDESMPDHYELLQPLVQALNTYVNDPSNGITKVYAAGHSLGGAMAQMYLAEHQAGPFSGVTYSGITFGSPGVQGGSEVDSRLTNIVIAGDPVPLADIFAGNDRAGDDTFVTQWLADIEGVYETTPALPASLAPPPPPPPPQPDIDLHSISLYVEVAELISRESTPIALIESVKYDFYAIGDEGHVRRPAGTMYGDALLNDLLRSSGGSQDFLYGLGGDDFLYPGDGVDFVDGGPGNDAIRGGAGGGDDTYIGGTGTDVVDYQSTSLGVVVDLAAAQASGIEIDADLLSGIENVIGGSGDDTIIGDGGDNVLAGGDGADVLYGDGGASGLVRASVASDGTEANEGSPNHFNTAAGPSLSGDGRYVAFVSSATNLVPDDTNGLNDVFVYDRVTQGVERVSVASDGSEQDGFSGFGADNPSISGDGRYVAFSSVATNLTGSDANGFLPDIYVYDRTTTTIERVSIDSSGVQGDHASVTPAISADGRFVAFRSIASNLVENDTNELADLFLFDRETGQTSRISDAIGGSEANGQSSAPSISADGRYVAFWSDATNLVVDDTNNEPDAFVYDRVAGTVERVSVGEAGVESNGPTQFVAMSGDGRYVAFSSAASNLVAGAANSQNVYIFDRVTQTTELVSVGLNGETPNAFSYLPSLSYDGRYVAFTSLASNLVADDTNGAMDVFVYDRTTDTTTRISVSDSGSEGNGFIFFNAERPSISANGHVVAFDGDAPDLVPGDTNEVSDIFVATIAGNDTLYGGDGDDLLFGGDGNDNLDGGADADELSGGVGNDTLIGGSGNDTLLGDDAPVPPPPPIETIVLQPGPEGEDLWITDFYSYNDNYGVDDGELRIGGWGDDYNALMRFDLSGLALEGPVENATLKLYNLNFNGGATTALELDVVHTAWDEAYGWHDYGLSTDYVATLPAPGLGWYEVDITDLVNGWLADPSQNFGLQLRPTDVNNNFLTFVSSDAIGELEQYRPTLVLNGESGIGVGLMSALTAAGADTLFGGEGNDTLEGGDGDDVLDGGEDSDVVSGGGGNDTIVGSPDGVSDDYDGGEDVDTLVFSSSTLGVWVDLTDNFSTGSETGDDSIINIENIVGGAGNDTIIGNEADNVLDGNGGDDVLDGGAGFDTGKLNLSHLTAPVDHTFSLEQGVTQVLPGGASYVNFEAMELQLGSGDDTIHYGTGVLGSLAVFANGGFDTLIVDVSATDLSLQATGGDLWALTPDFLSEHHLVFEGFESVEILGGSSGNYISGVNAEEVLFIGSDRGDTYVEGPGDDTVHFGAGSDSFYSYELFHFGVDRERDDEDVVYGEAGDDRFAFVYEPLRTGTTFLDGGDDFDWATLHLHNVTTAIEWTFDTTPGSVQTLPGGLSFVNMETVSLDLGAGDDTITFDAISTGRLGVNGHDGHDTLILDWSAVTEDVGDQGVAGVPGFFGSSLMATTSGSHIVTFVNFESVDIRTGSGNDQIFAASGNDHLDGGAGVDRVNYANAQVGVSVDLNLQGIAQDTLGGGIDTLENIEGVTGSSHDDTLIGDEGDNVLAGGLGADTLIGNGGSDTTSYDDGATFGILVDLAAFQASDGDTFDSIENVIGSMDADAIYGDGGANVLSGGAGDDFIDGRGGGDVVDGGFDFDTARFDLSDVTEPVVLVFAPAPDVVQTMPDGSSFVNIEALELHLGTGDDNVTFAVGSEARGGLTAYGGGGSDYLIIDLSEVTDYVSPTFGGVVVQAFESGSVEVDGLRTTSTDFFSPPSVDFQVKFGEFETVEFHAGSGGSRYIDREGNDLVLGGDGNDGFVDSSVSIPPWINAELAFADAGGHDVFAGGAGNDSAYLYFDPLKQASSSMYFDGGTGSRDWAEINYLDYVGDMDVSFDPTAGVENMLPGVILTNVENIEITLGAGDDRVHGVNFGLEDVRGGGGFDTLVVDLSAITSDVHMPNPFGALGTASGDQGTWFEGIEHIEVISGSGNDILDPTSVFNNEMASAVLYGNGGNDYLSGTDGGDLLDGGLGNDELEGWDGADTFVYAAGEDTIYDFEDGIDVIDLSSVADVDNLSDILARASDLGGDTLIDFGDGNTLTLWSVGLSKLSQDDFIFGNAAPTDILISQDTIAEGSAVGAVVGQLSATDADASDAFTYALLDDAGGRFSLNGADLVVAGGLDHEAAGSHEVTVRVTDSADNIFDKALTIVVSNVNEAPAVANPIADQSVAEDTAWAFVVPAGFAADVDTADLTFAASLGDGTALPGWLTFDAGARAFAGTPPANFNGTIDLKVTASDGEFSVSDTFALNVTAANDNPTITSNGAGNTAAVSIAENTAFVATVAAGDIDQAQTVRYRIGGGSDAALFAIDILAGTLAFVSAPDFDAPGDADQDNIYDVVVEAYDDENGADAQAIAVTVTNVGGANIVGTTGNDTNTGTNEEDTIAGRNGNDTINGLGGDDTLLGEGGNDTLNGGGGLDTLVGGTGNDVMDGGADGDTYRVAVGDGTDTFNDTGTTGVDRIIATANNVVLNMIGFGPSNGIEEISGNGFANVSILGTSAANTLNFSATMLTGIAFIDAGGGNDNVTGSAAADTILGGAGTDTLNGGLGADVLVGGLGNDTMNGGEDGDTYQFTRGDGLDVYADTGTSGTDRILLMANGSFDITGFGPSNGIEEINANGFNGVYVFGSAAANVLDFSATAFVGFSRVEGGDGNDTITTGAGAETLDGGFGTDTLNGGAGADTLIGAQDNDTLNGGEDGDTYHDRSGDGFDTYADTGTTGIDRIIATTNEKLDLTRFGPSSGIEEINANGFSAVFIQGSDGVDILDFSATTFVGIGQIYGASGNDMLTGTQGIDTMNGGTGRDTVNGAGGNDNIRGGSDADIMTGGAGNDTIRGEGATDRFVWTTTSGAGDGLGYDIVDANAAELEKLEFDVLLLQSLKQIDGTSLASGEQVLTGSLLGGGVASLARADQSHLVFDWDGDGVADLTIEFMGSVNTLTFNQAQGGLVLA